MNPYFAQVEGAVRAVEVLSPTTFSWFGKRSPRIVRSVERELTARTARNFLLYNLQSRLYSDFYCQGWASPTRTEHSGATRLTGDPGFLEELSAANTGRGYWESGWEVQRVEDGLVEAKRGGLHLLAYPEECLAPADETAAPGMGVRLRFPKESRFVSPGFYMAMGDSDLNEGGSGPFVLVRFYWNFAPGGAAPLMRGLTGRLNESGVPFRLKVINDPQGYVRCDSGVLYVSKEDYAAVSDIVAQVYADMAGHMRLRVPALTKQIAPGLGLAEDPGDGDSFGMHRCRLLAEGIVRAYEEGLNDLQERVQRVVDLFMEEGISLDAPHLRPDSEEYGVAEGEYQGAQRSAFVTRHSLPAHHSPLETAHALGTQIVQEAVWYEGKCNWIGAEVESGKDGQGPTRTVYRALGPDMYAGTAGVALFLGELYELTGDKGVCDTAIGAIKQALSRYEAIPPEARIGLYTGGMGIALAAVRLGILLEDVGLADAGTQIARSAIKAPLGTKHDLLVGSAGAIVGCLLLAQMLGEPAFLREEAASLGTAVIGAAHKRGAYYSWGESGPRAGRDLTGFSHGAAGIGYALLELWAVTGEAEYRQAAQAAFEYERTWFDREHANWPDFRDLDGRRGRRDTVHTFATAWCHGAPGIALSRLHAYDLLGDERCKEEAVLALQTTRQAIDAALESGLGNYSLCHGVAGNAGVLLQAERVLSDALPGVVERACQVGAAGVERYGSAGEPWPLGAGGGQTPGLMLGLAGTGYFYLRLHDRTTPCVLLLRKEEWAPTP